MNYRITALTAQKRNRQRVNVFLDGEFAFGLARVVAAWLSVGMELSDEKIAQLQDQDERETAYQVALDIINYRPRTEAEIRKNLNRQSAEQSSFKTFGLTSTGIGAQTVNGKVRS